MDKIEFENDNDNVLDIYYEGIKSSSNYYEELLGKRIVLFCRRTYLGTLIEVSETQLKLKGVVVSEIKLSEFSDFDTHIINKTSIDSFGLVKE